MQRSNCCKQYIDLKEEVVLPSLIACKECKISTMMRNKANNDNLHKLPKVNFLPRNVVTQCNIETETHNNSTSFKRKVECNLKNENKKLKKARNVSQKRKVETNSTAQNLRKYNWENKTEINKRRETKSRDITFQDETNNLNHCNNDWIASRIEEEEEEEEEECEYQHKNKINKNLLVVAPVAKAIAPLERQICAKQEMLIEKKMAAWPTPRQELHQHQMEHCAGCASAMELCVSKAPLALQLQAYISKECRLFKLEHPTCSRVDVLHIFREVFAVFIEHFGEYRSILHLIRDAYEAAINESAENIRRLRFTDIESKSSNSLHAMELMQLKESLNATISNQQSQLQAAQSLVHSLREQLAVVEHKNSILEHDLQRSKIDRAGIDEQVKLLARAMTEESARGASMAEKIRCQNKEIELLNARNKVLTETLKDLKGCIHNDAMSERNARFSTQITAPVTTSNEENQSREGTWEEQPEIKCQEKAKKYDTNASNKNVNYDMQKLKAGRQRSSHYRQENVKEQRRTSLLKQKINEQKIKQGLCEENKIVDNYFAPLHVELEFGQEEKSDKSRGSYRDTYVLSLLKEIDRLRFKLQQEELLKKHLEVLPSEQKEEEMLMIESIPRLSSENVKYEVDKRVKPERTCAQAVIENNKIESCRAPEKILGDCQMTHVTKCEKHSYAAAERSVIVNCYPIITEWLRFEGSSEKDLLETDYLLPPGKQSFELGAFLQLCEPVKNFHYSIEQIMQLLDKFWSWRESKLLQIAVKDAFVEWLTMESGCNKTALEIGYNILYMCQLNITEADCRAFLAILRNFLPEKIVLTWRQCLQELQEKCISTLQTTQASISYNTLFEILREVFPEKSYANFEQLRFCVLWQERERGNTCENIDEIKININEIFSQSSYFVRFVKLQLLREVEEMTLTVVEKIRTVANVKGNVVTIKNISSIFRECDPQASRDKHISLLAECCQKSICDVSVADDFATVALEPLLMRLRTCVLLRKTAPNDGVE